MPARSIIASSIIGNVLGTRGVVAAVERLRVIQPEVSPDRGDGPELEPADGPFLLAHHLGRLAGGEAGEEAKRDGVSLIVGQRRQGGTHLVQLLADHGDLVRPQVHPGVGVGGVQVRMFVAGPDMIDDGVTGQPEEPAPERDAPRLETRQSLQGLDEDELRQVLRVRRALDAAGDEAIDRHVIVVEQEPEGPGVSALRLLDEPIDRVVVKRHNERPARALGAPSGIVSRRSASSDASAHSTPALAAAAYPSSSAHANASARWASEPTVTAVPPSSR